MAATEAMAMADAARALGPDVILSVDAFTPDEVAALIDADTNLANRARFLDVLEAEWQRALYTQSAIAVAVVDVGV